eukprot:TRINITY_DN2072_c0_g1_i1.p2 TRINITY_DN2072_c0_g1~~TRINITY_DN2072_c0_g1_i1.p2  ORF type:complete len:179 (-),score=39.02 TRINITY_DN2072_c0_g1_i1:67-603(-)
MCIRDSHNIDISSIVIDQMLARNASRDKMKYYVMDATKLEFADKEFDVVIDKSTIDSILCAEDSFLMVARMLNESSRVLKTGGYYFGISYGAPENRIFHYQREHLSFSLEHSKIEKIVEEDGQQQTLRNYTYLCQKLEDADEKMLKNWSTIEKTLIEEEAKEKELNKKWNFFFEEDKE